MLGAFLIGTPSCVRVGAKSRLTPLFCTDFTHTATEALLRQQDRRAFILFLSVTAFALALTAMYLAGHKVVHTEIVIPAPTAKVWSVLSDQSSYSKWHPVIAHVEGRLEPGERIVSAWTNAEGEQHKIEADVVRYKEERLLNLYGGTPLILTFDHRYELEPIPEGTRVTQHEEYRGIGVLWWEPTRTSAAHASANEGLRKYVMELK